MKAPVRSAIAAAVSLAAAGCGSMMGQSISAPAVPDAVAAPQGHTATMLLKGSGLLTYECRAAGAGSQWAFVGPDAVLTDGAGKQVGKYYGGPTWEHADGSKVTGKQLATAPAGAGAIPLQLVQASPAMAPGAFSGVTYIQRVNTQGGVAPSEPCTQAMLGGKKTVGYSADYVFYKQ
jgi:hypothetical protein